MIYLLSPSVYSGVVSMPMVTFSPVAQAIDFQDCDTLLFTSKNSVKIANDIDPKWREYPSIAIGKETAKTITELGGHLVALSKEAYASSVAELIEEDFKNSKILYLRPEVVSSENLATLVRQQVIYKTKCVAYPKSKQPRKKAVIIVTSPSTIRCFLENFEWQESYHAVAIGRVTAEALPPFVRYSIASEPTISACISLAKELDTAQF